MNPQVSLTSLHTECDVLLAQTRRCPELLEGMTGLTNKLRVDLEVLTDPYQNDSRSRQKNGVHRSTSKTHTETTTSSGE